MDLKKEAEYFGDIVVVPYMDNYELVVLKTVAICEYGVSGVVRPILYFIFLQDLICFFYMLSSSISSSMDVISSQASFLFLFFILRLLTEKIVFIVLVCY